MDRRSAFRHRRRPVRLVFVLASVVLGGAALPGPVSADPWWCESGWSYENVSTSSTPFYMTWETVVFNGNYEGSITSTATNTESQTVGVGGSITLKVQANAVVAGVEASSSFNVSTSLTTGYSVSNTMTIPPRKYGHFEHGVVRVKAYGRLVYREPVGTSCAITQDKGYLTTYSPWKRVWQLYTNGSW